MLNEYYFRIVVQKTNPHGIYIIYSVRTVKDSTKISLLLRLFRGLSWNLINEKKIKKTRKCIDVLLIY